MIGRPGAYPKVKQGAVKDIKGRRREPLKVLDATTPNKEHQHSARLTILRNSSLTP